MAPYFIRSRSSLSDIGEEFLWLHLVEIAKEKRAEPAISIGIIPKIIQMRRFQDNRTDIDCHKAGYRQNYQGNVELLLQYDFRVCYDQWKQEGNHQSIQTE